MRDKDDKTRETIFDDGNHVDVKNDVISGDYPKDMKAADFKMLRFIISQCKKGDEEFFEYEFKAADFAEFMSIDKFNLYKEAVEMAEKRLFNCNLRIGTEDDHELIHLFKKCTYKNGTFVMRMDDEAAKLFLGLENNFTEIPIAPILAMKNKNSIRIYELICKKFMSKYPHSTTATCINITLDELREVTETKGKKTYDHIGHLKEKILNPSIAEIEGAAGWKIIVTNVKSGRSVIGFDLVVWTQYGYKVVERCKRTGEFPDQTRNQGNRQMTLFDIEHGE